MELPDFLNRNKQKEPVMTTPPPAQKPAKTKRRDAYIATVKVTIPISTSDPNSFAEAVKAVQQMRETLPDDAQFTVTGTLGKV